MSWSGLLGQLQREGRIYDGSFEHQMIYEDPYIPSVIEWETTYYTEPTAWQKIAAEQNGDPLYPGTSNHWVQTGPTTGNRWAISADRAYPQEKGHQGIYSAKYVFGNDPSPWLIPFHPQWNPYWVEQGWTEEQILTNIWSATHDGNGPYISTQLVEGGYMPIAINPPLNKETLVCHAWSDGPCDIELYWRLWTGSIELANVPPTYHYDLAVDSAVRSIPANQWTECRGDFMVPFGVWPNYPAEMEDWADSYFQLYKLRAKNGIAGQVVYLDNVWAWPDLTTRGSGLITVGVSEWVRDDRGMYIGAYLWFKTGTGTGSAGESQL